MPVLWTKGVETGRITMNEFVAVTSSNIAKILNIYPRKGAIAVGGRRRRRGCDPKKSKTITAAAQRSIIDYNVFEGVEVERSAALHALARRDRLRRRQNDSPRPVSRPSSCPASPSRGQ